ncbi:phage head-tail adapter protein [Aquamicrobium defluvii]|uniref:Phage head-tail adapter protein n=2 Tax=Aquamicrobium defluvii TaxID=69279 RepID=A0A011TAG3_9HYPH|nr:phage head-tail adapter protein [Aquamicrobium defluvii]EZQ14874.1 phage head-tail adapter protein [Halopseudomonas bauzanensis]
MMALTGNMTVRVHCQKTVDATDELGNPVPGGGKWETQFTVLAAFEPKTGGEQVLAGRLQGVQAYIVTIWQSEDTRKITPGWQLVDADNAARTFNIRSLFDPTGRRQKLELLVEHGVAS